MLSVLKFKSSLSEGVLDGGESEIFLGGTKMKQFMESVEKVAESIPLHVPTVEETSGAFAAQESEAPVEGEPSTDDTPAARAPQQSWDELLAAGLDLLGKLGQVMQPSGMARTVASPTAGLIARNERTGAPELRIPLPDAETAERVSSLLEGLANVLRIGTQTGK
jgi:hypothetical protein